MLRAKELNAKRQAVSDAVFGVTVFSDMSETEFRTKVLTEKSGDNYPTPQDKNDNVVDFEMKVASEDVPDEWDWRQHGAVTRVKNQGGVGSCWAFSAAANIEGQYALSKGGELVDLSVEQIVDCDGSMFMNGTGDCGPNGGYPMYAYDYVLGAGGLEPWPLYPYCIGDFSCEPCPPPGYNKTICGSQPAGCQHKDDCSNKFDPTKILASIDSWAWLAPDKNETLLKEQLYQNGPVSIAIDALPLQFYLFGIVPSYFCSSNPNSADHAVLLTGYGTEKDLFLQETEYWEVKNSWGEICKCFFQSLPITHSFVLSLLYLTSLFTFSSCRLHINSQGVSWGISRWLVTQTHAALLTLPRHQSSTNAPTIRLYLIIFSLHVIKPLHLQHFPL